MTKKKTVSTEKPLSIFHVLGIYSVLEGASEAIKEVIRDNIKKATNPNDPRPLARITWIINNQVPEPARGKILSMVESARRKTCTHPIGKRFSEDKLMDTLIKLLDLIQFIDELKEKGVPIPGTGYDALIVELTRLGSAGDDEFWAEIDSLARTPFFSWLYEQISPETKARLKEIGEKSHKMFQRPNYPKFLDHPIGFFVHRFIPRRWRKK